MKTLIAAEKMVPLAPLTTLDLGGPATQLVRISSISQAQDAVRWWLEMPADSRLPLLPLGGGSNLLVADAGFDGLVLKLENRELNVLAQDAEHVLLRVGAGMVWDDLVSRCASEAWAGLECLSGIPGSVGASPVQNIGAYGQEVSETIVRVDGVDLRTGDIFSLSNRECQFAYRHSLFKSSNNYLITAVTFRLSPNGAPTIRYGELQDRVAGLTNPSLLVIRDLVLEIRRSKSMVYDKADPNHRSAGSFFTNPVVSSDLADQIQAALGPATGFPRFSAGPGLEKLSAAWLIDKSGLNKGFKQRVDAKVGLSTNHALALTNRGGGTASELLDLCQHVQAVVKERFSIDLVPEPVFVGF